MGRLGQWILRLAAFKFKVKHNRGTENMVADDLSRMFEGVAVERTEVTCAALLDSLPLVYTSLEEHQKGDDFCQSIVEKIRKKQPGGEDFHIRALLLS